MSDAVKKQKSLLKKDGRKRRGHGGMWNVGLALNDGDYQDLKRLQALYQLSTGKKMSAKEFRKLLLTNAIKDGLAGVSSASGSLG
jgi:hypothetical protein